jgi:aryl-alcohol dehydrogenase-like predicted oxidoreductase
VDLTSYRTLGRSGLAVSPIALGTMTFGREDWGADAAHSQAIFDRYTNAGGNFIDTANVYADGESEALLGRFIRESQSRDRIVLATKAGLVTDTHPNASGLGSKNIHAALDASLRRLQTDHVDLFWLHLWDFRTPVEEVVQTMSALVRSGKIRYWGLSNTPAWIVARIATLAAANREPPPIGLQYEYSLLERSVEIDLVPLATEMGMGMVPWSPLGAGFLTGKYRRSSGGDQNRPVAGTGEGRLSADNPLTNTQFNARNWMIVDTLAAVAEQIGSTPAKAALAWLIGRPAVTAPLLGVRNASQLDAAFGAFELTLERSLVECLEVATAPILTYPATLFDKAASPVARLRPAILNWHQQSGVS